MKSFIQISLVLLLLLIWGLAIGYFKTGSTKKLNLPDLKSFNGESFSFQSSQKKVIYVWATWCVVCKSTLWLVKANHKLLNFFGIPFYSVEEGSDMAKLKSYLTEKEIEFPVLIGNEKFIQEMGIRGFPTYLFLNEKSEKVFFDEGYLTPFGVLIRILFL